MRFVYCYFMKNEPERVRQTAPEHTAYWRSLELRGYLGGPFENRSGGLITFQAPEGAAAEELVSNDPFLQRGLIDTWWLQVWLPQ
jgi:uncharacterized protein YciI